jgi:CelD/BcsL family acetyltransferase involved in cellulose biosynthesis
VAFLGDRVASDYMDIFAKPGYEEICCRAVFQRMRDQGSVSYDLFELNAVCEDSNLYRYLSLGAEQNKDIMILPIFDCPRTRLAGSFDRYLAGLSGSTRYALGRKQRRFERDFAATAIEHADLAQHPELLEVLFSLHKSRWDMLEDKTSTFYSAFRKSFNERLLRRLGEGDGFFSCVSVDGKPASILYILGYKKNAFFYQNGWDPKFADYSIGLYNIQQAIRHAIEAGYESFDFLRGEEAYKYKFCEESRQAYSVLCFGAGSIGRLARTLFLFKKRTKNLLFSLRTLSGRVIRPGEHYFFCLEER